MVPLNKCLYFAFNLVSSWYCTSHSVSGSISALGLRWLQSIRFFCVFQIFVNNRRSSLLHKAVYQNALSYGTGELISHIKGESYPNSELGESV